MNDNGFLYNLERAQAGPVDEEALARKMAARTARVARAHESVFTEANGWSGQFPGTPGYYYFADSDEGQIYKAMGGRYERILPPSGGKATQGHTSTNGETHVPSQRNQ